MAPTKKPPKGDYDLVGTRYDQTRTVGMDSRDPRANWASLQRGA